MIGNNDAHDSVMKHFETHHRCHHFQPLSTIYLLFTYLPMIYLSFYHIFTCHISSYAEAVPPFFSRGHGHLGRALRGDLLGRPWWERCCWVVCFLVRYGVDDDGFLCFYMFLPCSMGIYGCIRDFFGGCIGKIEFVDIFLVG